jgi:hypothetical protein
MKTHKAANERSVDPREMNDLVEQQRLKQNGTNLQHRNSVVYISDKIPLNNFL